MKNKGFTLVELLAVIIILAIIALIVVPVIINIINEARTSGEERSLELYGSAVEVAAANYRAENIYTDVSGIYVVRDDGKTLINTNDPSIVLKVTFKGTVACKTVVIYEDQSIYISYEDPTSEDPADPGVPDEKYGILKGDVDLDGVLTEVDIIVMRMILANGPEDQKIEEYLPSGRTLDEATINEISERIDLNRDGKWTIADLDALKKLITLKGDMNLDNVLDEKDIAVMKIILANGPEDQKIEEYLPSGRTLDEATINEISERIDLNGDGKWTIDDLSLLKNYVEKIGGIKVSD